MSKAKYLLYGGLIAIIGGGTPYFMGQLVETKFKDVVALLPELNPQISAQTIKYERGWFQSYAQTKITFNNLQALKPFLPQDQKGQTEPFTVLLEHNIHHGPFVRLNPKSYKEWVFARAVVHSNLMLKEKSKEVLKTELGDENILNLTSQIKMDGAVLLNLTSKKIERKKPEETLVWQGFNGKWQLSPKLDRLQGEFGAPGFDYQSSNSHLNLQNVTFKNDYTRTTENFWVGKCELGLAQFKWEQKVANINLSIEGFTGGALMNLHDKIIDSYVNFKIQKIANDEVYGPVLIDISLKNLSASLYKSLLDIARNPNVLNNPNLFAQQVFLLLPEILRTRPQLTLEDLKIRTKDGDIQAKFSFAAGGPELGQGADFNKIFNSIDAKANFSFPKTVFKAWMIQDFEVSDAKEVAPAKAEAFIAEWVRQGFLIEKGDYYLSQLELAKGAFKVNGKDFQMPMGNAGGGMPMQPSPSLPVN